MGVPVGFRKLLLDILASRQAHRKERGAQGATEPCWYAELPPEARPEAFDVVILDLMQELALVKQSKVDPSGSAAARTMNGADVAKRIKQALYNHLEANLADCKEVTARTLVVGCLDNHFAVPRNKSFVQSERDEEGGSGSGSSSSSSGDTGSEDTEPPPATGFAASSPILDSAGHDEAVRRTRAYRYACAFDEGMRKHQANEALARKDAEAVAAAFDAMNDFLVTEGPLPVDGVTLWRSASTRWQLTRLVTEAVMTMNVAPGKSLLLDDGIPLNQLQYKDLAARMVADHEVAPGCLSPFECATLVGQLMSSCVRRVLVKPGHIYRELESTAIGESDLKILYYVQRRPPLGLARPSGGRTRYLVKCQDTDVMWQLLMHMRTLINPATRNVDEVDVWLDTQTPGDRSRGVAQPYRFIDMVALWRQTHAMLREEFPKLRNPMEWLFFIVFCNRNDYVEPLPPAFKIGPARIWALCAAAAAHASDRSRYPTAAKVERRPKVPERFPDKLAAALVDMTVAQERPSDSGSVASDLSTDGVVHDAPVFLRAQAAVMMFYHLLQTSPVIKHLVGKYKSSSRWAALLDGHISSPEEFITAVQHLHQMYTSELPEAERSKVAPLFGIPTLAQMKGRVARIQWTMNYFINGWKTPHYRSSWARRTEEFSVHGWELRDVTGQMATNPNSLYLYSEYVPARSLNPLDPDERPIPGHYRLFQVAPAFDVKTMDY